MMLLLPRNNVDVSTDDSEIKPWKVTAKIHEAKRSAETTFSVLIQSPFCTVYLKDKDIQVNFMHQHKQINQFFWPSREDICWEPVTAVLLKLDVSSTSNGRTYSITEEEFQKLARMCK